MESLEERVTAIEKLPARMERLESQILQLRGEMGDEFSAVRREMRVLHEDAIARIALIGEGLTAQGEAIAGISRNIDESRAETRAMFDTLIGRMAAVEKRLAAKRPRKK